MSSSPFGAPPPPAGPPEPQAQYGAYGSQEQQPIGTPYYHPGPPPQGVPQYDMSVGAKTLRQSPDYADPRRHRFTGKQLFGLIASFSLVSFFVGAIFMALIFQKAIDVFNAIVSVV